MCIWEEIWHSRWLSIFIVDVLAAYESFTQRNTEYKRNITIYFSLAFHVSEQGMKNETGTIHINNHILM